MARSFLLLQAIAFCLCIRGLEADVPKPVFSASEVEAVFLVNFCRFTSWPEDVFSAPNQPITIAVWADERFASLVAHAARGEHVGQRPITVKRVQNAAEAESAQLVFVAESAELAFERTFVFEDSHALLVGESSHFLSSGGHLQFVPAGKIQIRVSLPALRESGLELNSNLLRICQTQ